MNDKNIHSDRANDHMGDLEIALHTIPKNLNETQTTAMSGEQLGIDNDDHSGNPCLGAGFLHCSLLSFGTIAKFDNEAKRILSLVIPFTSSAIVHNASGLFVLVIISHSLGTDQMVAYAMVGSIIGVVLALWVDGLKPSVR